MEHELARVKGIGMRDWYRRTFPPVLQRHSNPACYQNCGCCFREMTRYRQGQRKTQILEILTCDKNYDYHRQHALVAKAAPILAGTREMIIQDEVEAATSPHV